MTRAVCLIVAAVVLWLVAVTVRDELVFRKLDACGGVWQCGSPSVG